MKQRIELFEFFMDKVPIQEVEYLESSQILTNFSVHFTSTSMGSREIKEEKKIPEEEFKRRQSLVSTISKSKQYKEMFFSIKKEKDQRKRRFSAMFQKYNFFLRI